MKPGNLIPGATVFEAVGTGARAMSQHAVNNVQARTVELAGAAHDQETDEAAMAAAGPDPDSLAAYAVQRTAREHEITTQVTAIEAGKDRRSRHWLIGIGVFSGGLALAGACIGGAVAYSAYRATDSVNRATAGAASAAKAAADAAKTIFTEQQMSAVEIQNVAKGFKLPGTVIIATASLDGSTEIDTQGQFADFQGGQSTKIPGEACGEEQVLVNFNAQGVEVSASKDAAGKGELSIQVPLSAITTQFVPGTVVGPEGVVTTSCPAPKPVDGFFVGVGSQSQGVANEYAMDQVTSQCVEPVKKMIQPGIRNSMHGNFKFGSLTVQSVAAMLSEPKAEQARIAFIDGLLPTMPIDINIVEPKDNADAAGGVRYFPADISQNRFGISAVPTRAYIAAQLQESESHVTLPPPDKTQCLMTNPGVDDYNAILNNPQQFTLSPTSSPSTPPTILGATN